MFDATDYHLPRAINSDGTDDSSTAFDLDHLQSAMHVNETIMKNKCFTQK
jgi:hypothetical protein